MKHVMAFHFFEFFKKKQNDKDFHQKCYLFIDVDETRNVFFSIVFIFFLNNVKDFHQKCYCLIDFDEKRNGFLTFLQFFLKNDKDFH